MNDERIAARISCSSIVKSVQNLVKLTEDETTSSLAENQNKLNLTLKQQERWQKKCLCLVEFDEVKIIEHPLEFDHQGNMAIA